MDLLSNNNAHSGWPHCVKFVLNHDRIMLKIVNQAILLPEWRWNHIPWAQKSKEGVGQGGVYLGGVGLAGQGWGGVMGEGTCQRRGRGHRGWSGRWGLAPLPLCIDKQSESITFHILWNAVSDYQWNNQLFHLNNFWIEICLATQLKLQISFIRITFKSFNGDFFLP